MCGWEEGGCAQSVLLSPCRTTLLGSTLLSLSLTKAWWMAMYKLSADDRYAVSGKELYLNNPSPEIKSSVRVSNKSKTNKKTPDHWTPFSFYYFPLLSLSSSVQHFEVIKYLHKMSLISVFLQSYQPHALLSAGLVVQWLEFVIWSLWCPFPELSHSSSRTLEKKTSPNEETTKRSLSPGAMEGDTVFRYSFVQIQVRRCLRELSV